jgi:A/G-specific adenine glycosylase
MSIKNRQIPSSKQAKEAAAGKRFAEKLLAWNRDKNTRQMPWKGEKDPYKIWLSEIILQQTRVEQGLKYYENFISNFPDVHALAGAPEEKVFKLWEGLGYYSRCKNLIATARLISRERNGVFPGEHGSLLQLKGIGNYTASAIASFAYNLPYAVLDGNVFRVLSRIFDIDTPIDSAKGKKQFSELAQALLPPGKAGSYNQAIMDFGAVVCKPLPDCDHCFFNRHCKAYGSGRQDLLPIKEKRTKIRERWLNYFVLRDRSRVLMRQRTANDIWQQLFEFLLIETPEAVPPKKMARIFEKQYGPYISFIPSSASSQRLTHQHVHFSFYEVGWAGKEVPPGFFWVKIADLDKYAFPKSLQHYVAAQLK